MKIFYLALLSAVCFFHTTLRLTVVANMMELEQVPPVQNVSAR